MGEGAGSQRFNLQLLIICACVLSHPRFSSAQSRTDLVTVYNQSLPILLNGINNYVRTAYTSTYVIWAPLGFPVALSTGTSPLPVAVAVQLPSSSRLVAIGHEGIVGSCCSANDGWDKLVVNTFRWLSAAKTTNRSTIRLAATADMWWATSSLGKIAQALKSSSSTPLNVTWDNNANLTAIAAGAWNNVDILCLDTYTTYTEAQIAGLLRFANQTGKGLLVAGHIWYWSYSHPGANIFIDASINRILWPLGLAVTTNAESGPMNPPTSPPLGWLLYNAYYVATSLLAAKNGSLTFPPAGQSAAVINTLTQLVNTLPARANSSASRVDGVWALLDQIADSTVAIGPGARFDVTAANVPTLLSVLFEVNRIRTSDIFNLRASPSAALYPGPVPATAPRVQVTLTLNATYTPTPYHFYYGDFPGRLWVSTGLYAPPGEIINVTLNNASAIGKGLRVQIGAHSDDLTSAPTWDRLPLTCTTFALNSAVTRAGNPLGGAVFVTVPDGSTLGSLQVTISGAVRAPYFKMGVHSVADWASTIRNYPAPWAELDSGGKFIIMLPSSAIRSLSDPTPVLQHWNEVMDHMADLAVIPRARARAERFLVDAQISAGWMHSGYPIMAYDEPGVHDEMLNVANLKAKGAWGPYHELGHNHQWGEMQFSGTTESFVNLFTVYVLEMTNVPVTAWENTNFLPEGQAALIRDYLAAGANWAEDWNVWVALTTYLQLKDAFGWNLYKNLYRTYQNFTSINEDEVQLFIQTSSKVAGVNLVPFYRIWAFPITSRTINLTSGLPQWLANPMLRPPPSPSPVRMPPPPVRMPPPPGASIGSAIELGSAASIAPWSAGGPGVNFPDGQARWIWSHAAANTVGASADVRPVFSTTITVARQTQVVLNMVADDMADVFVRGVLVFNISTNWNLPSYPANYAKNLTLTAGANTISLRVTNTGGPAGVVASISSNNGQTVLTRTSSSAWTYSVETIYPRSIELGSASSVSPWSAGGPGKNFPDGQAQWIWSTAGANNGAATTPKPVFITTITVSQNTQVLLNMVADDIADVYVNGVLITVITTNWNLPSYPTNGAIPLTLVTGTNVISIRVTNTAGPAGMVASITSSDGRTVLARTSSFWTVRV